MAGEDVPAYAEVKCESSRYWSEGLGGGRRRVDVGDGLIGVLEAEARVDGDGGGGAGAGGRRNERSRIGAVAGGVDAVDGRRLACVDGDGAIGAQGAAQRAGDLGAQAPADEEEQRVAVERLPVVKTHATQTPVVVAVQRDDRRLDDRDAEGLHARELVGG